MARTPLMQQLRRLARECHLAHAGRVELTQVQEGEQQRRERARRRSQDSPTSVSRRNFLALGSTAAAGGLLSLGFSRAHAAAQPRIAIVGGGLAGLTAALELCDHGYTSTIYEALGRIGGRTRSEGPNSSPTMYASAPGCGSCHQVSRKVSGLWDDGQVTDIFGELIDTGHTYMLGLAGRFGLPLIDLLAWEPQGATETYYFLGQRYAKADADRDFAALYPTIKSDLNAAGYPTTWDRSRPGGRVLDAMSIYDWIESRVPGGHRHPLGQLLDVAYNIEFGAETTDQSALSLIYLLGYSPSRSTLSVYGESDERYRIAAGIETLPQAIASYIAPMTAMATEHKLIRIARQSGGGYDLTFGRGFPTFNDEVTVSADVVILTLPFAALRTLDFADAGFDPLKTRTIHELGAGRNGKLHLQFTDRLWNRWGPWGISGGTSYADTGYQVTWEATRGQGGRSGILVNFTGGAVTDSLKLQHAYGSTAQNSAGVQQDARDFLARVAPVFPGIGVLWNGRAAGAIAHLNPLWNLSYSYWRVGQYQSIAGYEGVPQGQVYFAGEHTSVDFQGWMEGAARSGARAANEVMAAIRGR